MASSRQTFSLALLHLLSAMPCQILRKHPSVCSRPPWSYRSKAVSPSAGRSSRIRDFRPVQALPTARRCTATTPTSSTRSRPTRAGCLSCCGTVHGQSAKTWETTPDGREGFQTIFLGAVSRCISSISRDVGARLAARSHEPHCDARRTDSGSGCSGSACGRTSSRACSSRRSRKPSTSSSAQMVPNTGPFDAEVNAAAVSALFDKIGPGDPRHALAERRPGLAYGHQEPERSRHRRVRARQRLRLPGR